MLLYDHVVLLNKKQGIYCSNIQSIKLHQLEMKLSTKGLTLISSNQQFVKPPQRKDVVLDVAFPVKDCPP